MHYYVCKKDDDAIIEKLSELSEKYPTRGFENYYGKIRLQGLKWNRKRVLRVYHKLNLQMRRKRKRKIPSRVKEALIIPATLNDTWSVDFMNDSLENGRRFRVLNVINDYNRKALINEASILYSCRTLGRCT
jgi:putative transposase